jgi:hypothetical protein
VKPHAIRVVHSGHPGRPRKVPNPIFLRHSLSTQSNVRLGSLARKLGIHRNTLRHYVQNYNIDMKYADISDDDLDELVREFRVTRPTSGLRYLSGAMRVSGIRVQKRRLAESLHRVDPVGRVLRRRATIQRRRYKVSRPNALWHQDGHHKLIRWGIVIHGIVDSYCRTVSSIPYLTA